MGLAPTGGKLMAGSTGPVLALGAITVINQNVFNGKPWDWKVPVATGVACGGLALLEQVSPKFAVGLAWISLGAVLVTRLDPRVPSPVETFAQWWESYGK